MNASKPGELSAEARAVLARQDSFATDAEAAEFWAKNSPHCVVEDGAFTGAAGQRQPLRIYRGRAGAPTLLYIHGGGWVGGSIALNDRAARSLAAFAGWTVVSVSYRLAPQHPFPAGLEDCRAALDWIRREGAAHGLDTARIGAAGASAGANLAMALALQDRALCALVLYYGVFGADFETASYRRYAHGYGLDRERVMEIFDLYDAGAEARRDPRLLPLMATDFSGIPDTLVLAAECDVLADDSRALAHALGAAGVNAVLHVEPAVPHGFINRGRMLPAATECLARSAAFLTTRSCVREVQRAD